MGKFLKLGTFSLCIIQYYICLLQNDGLYLPEEGSSINIAPFTIKYQEATTNKEHGFNIRHVEVTHGDQVISNIWLISTNTMDSDQ